jgi:hypothetical protein
LAVGNSIAVAGIRKVRVADGSVVPHGAEWVGSLGRVISRKVIGGRQQHFTDARIKTWWGHWGPLLVAWLLAGVTCN